VCHISRHCVAVLTSLDYAGNKPENVVRVGNSNGSPQIALSTDGGQTWNAHSGTDDTKNSGTLAYSADADTIVWSSGNAGVLRSQNQGTFTAVASVPSGAVIAADKRNNTVFYAGSGAAFYRSTDTGATFTTVSSAFGSQVTAVKDITAHPVVAGEVWVSTNAGLFRSTNYGSTFAKVGAGSISKTEQLAFGKGEGSAWNVYAFGVGAAGNKLYASSDNGASWVDIQGSQGFGSMVANRVVGSGNVAGQVYVGTNGRGVLYAKVSVPGGGSGPSTSSAAPSSTSSASKTSSVQTTLTTSTIKTSTSTSVKTSTKTSTVKSTSTTSSAPSTSATALAQRWGQCGGLSWTGPTQCVSPYTCQKQNPWYSQCL
jgi:xyloglucan-specific exo-beta-1,4-glucanase